MKIALLGGNSYEYAFAPSYIHANGKGYISQNDLMGAEARAVDVTPEYAAQLERDLKAEGKPVPANVAELAAEYRRTKANNVFSIIDKGMGLVDKGLGLFSTKGQPAATTDMAGRSQDNTALIIIGGVAGVAVLATVLATKKKKRR